MMAACSLVRKELCRTIPRVSLLSMPAYRLSNEHLCGSFNSFLARCVFPICCSGSTIVRHIHICSTSFVKAKQRQKVWDGSGQKQIAKEKSERGFQEQWDIWPGEDDEHTPESPAQTKAEMRADGAIRVFGGSVLIPGAHTDDALFDGVKFKDLPTVHIKAAWNNTILSVTNGPGDKVFYSTSCGVEGFKNAKKGTNIAAQSTGINCATKCVAKGLRTVRVVVNGIGPGRMSAVKGLQMGGCNIVSLSDDTYYNTNKRPPRPRSI